MSKNAPIFEWDQETGQAMAVLFDGKNTFVGTASCCPEDTDMKSEKTGCTIALYRAEIEYYMHIRDNVLQPQLSALQQLYYSMNRSKNFDPKSYENIMLQRQIRQKQFDLETIKELLTTKRETLRTYISEKDKIYKKIRANREGQK